MGNNFSTLFVSHMFCVCVAKKLFVFFVPVNVLYMRVFVFGCWANFIAILLLP